MIFNPSPQKNLLMEFLKMRNNKMKIFIATKNQKKLVELSRILEPMGFDVICENDLEKPLCEVEETGTTFEENALLKAKAGLEETGYISVADDSGLCIDYLDGAPGIYSARYSGGHGNDEMNNRKILEELDGVPVEQRGAKFVSAIACVFPDGRSFTVRGECHGYIAFEESGNGGFGYDPLFIGELGCFGELTPEQKDSVSHRGKSLRLFREELKKYIGGDNNA